MSLINTWNFTKTIINWETIEKATHNIYRVVSVRPYIDKKGILPEGYSLTLMVTKDDYDYKLDKKGQPRENNLYQNFDATILSKKKLVKKGDIIRLLDFDSEHSFAINFDLILRFKDFELVQNQGTKVNA
ncbi:MAG: hypothetical protein JJE18_07055 [Eubacteriaceae bacterium]|nr:hypothetical protein [Eubacteriaceae bacterium]